MSKIMTRIRMKLEREIEDKKEVSKIVGERDSREKEVLMSCVPDDFCNKRRI